MIVVDPIDPVPFDQYEREVATARNDLRIALEDARLARVARDEASLACSAWRARAIDAEAVIVGIAKLFPTIVRAIREGIS